METKLETIETLLRQLLASKSPAGQGEPSTSSTAVANASEEVQEHVSGDEDPTDSGGEDDDSDNESAPTHVSSY